MFSFNQVKYMNGPMPEWLSSCMGEEEAETSSTLLPENSTALSSALPYCKDENSNFLLCNLTETVQWVRGCSTLYIWPRVGCCRDSIVPGNASY